MNEITSGQDFAKNQITDGKENIVCIQSNLGME
jgi:hypothetical protein